MPIRWLAWTRVQKIGDRKRGSLHWGIAEVVVHLVTNIKAGFRPYLEEVAASVAAYFRMYE
jgi:hypothetical protein